MYTDLIKIEHPPEAVAGTLVAIDIYVKNQHSSGIYLKATASVNDNVIVVVSPSQVTAEPGVTYIIRGVFTMPDVNAVIRAESWYLGVDQVWYQEDYQTRTVVVTGGVDPLFETLEVDITPAGTGYVVSDPASEEGRVNWIHDSTGQFVYGANVLVTAIPFGGYVFDHWSDEITGGTTINNPAYVQPMTEPRTIKAHFREESVEELVETLEVDITPAGVGTVTTFPASNEGKTSWVHDDVGTFPRGTDVQVTAVPLAGYEFEKWSDEIAGGVSYENPAMVQALTISRSVKCHFREAGTAGPPSGSIVSVFVGVSSGGFAVWESFDRLALPYNAAVTDREFKLAIIGLNDSEVEYSMGVRYTITKPDGSTIVETAYETFETDPGVEHEFIEPGLTTLALDQTGDWSVKVELLAEGVDTPLDTFESGLFTGVEEAPKGTLGGIADMIPMLLIVMVMSLMMNMMSDFGGTVQRAKEIAQPIIQVFTGDRDEEEE